MTEREVLHTTQKVYKPPQCPDDTPGTWKSTLTQLYATSVLCSFMITVGMLFVMPTIVLGALHNKQGDPLSLNDSEASWISSIGFVCYPLGSLAAGLMSESLGRRGALIPVNIVFICGWLSVYYAQSVHWLYFGTLLLGFGMGLCEVPAAAYLGETTEPRLRGSFSLLITAAANIGTLFELSVGSLLDWRKTALASAVVPIVSLLLLGTIPESPVWLIARGRTAAAQRALGWLRGFKKPEDVQREFDELVHYTTLSNKLSNEEEEQKQEPEGEPNNKNNPTENTIGNWFKARYKELTSPKVYLPLRFILICYWFSKCAVLLPFKAFMVEILKQFWFPFDQNWVMVMTGAVGVIGSIVPVFIVKNSGKRKLGLYSMAIATIFIFTMGFFTSFFTHTKHLVLAWLLVINFGVLSLISELGVLSIPYMLSTEVFPVRAKGIANGLSSGCISLMAFLMTKSFLYLKGLFGLSGMYYLYGAMSLLGCIYYYFYLPETEGKTLEKIETYFTPNHDRKEKFRMPPRDGERTEYADIAGE